MQIVIERVEPGGLRRQVWAFYFLSDYTKNVLRLDEWEPQDRRTRRHKWVRAGEGYRSRSHNGTIHHGGYRTPASAVPLPDDVIADARTAVVHSIKIVGPVDPPDMKP